MMERKIETVGGVCAVRPGPAARPSRAGAPIRPPTRDSEALAAPAVRFSALQRSVRVYGVAAVAAASRSVPLASAGPR